MRKTVRLYRIRKNYAEMNKLSIFIEASVLYETTKALYLYGKGEYRGHVVIIDQWFPKMVLSERDPVTTVVNIPDDHHMLPNHERKGESAPADKIMRILNGTKLEILKSVYSHDQKYIKSMDGSDFDPIKRRWTVPYTEDTLRSLKSRGFLLDPESEKLLKPVSISVADIPKQIPGLNATLYNFQHVGVAAIEYLNGRTLLADEMGLGKTIQSLAWAQLKPEIRPIIIITPSNVKLKWEREALQFMTNVTVQVLFGQTVNCKLHADIIIINYDILKYWINELLHYNAKLLITDECHMYKNNKAARTKAVKRLAKQMPHHLALSGTPILSRPIEIFNAINLLVPGLFPNYWKFGMRYCDGKSNGFAWDFSGATNMEELHNILTSSVMVRRKKSDVLDELPDKQFSFVPMTITNRKEYNVVERNFLSYIMENKGRWSARLASSAEHLTKIEALKQVAVEGKMKEVVDWVENFIESGEKLVVFAIHRAVVEKLSKKFSNRCVTLVGGMTDIQKQKVIDSFQKDKNIPLFIGNIRAAGTSITLTAASNVAFIEFPWTPGELTQAADRCHRITQKNAVTIYYLVANNTIDEKIAKLLDEKQLVLDAVLDGKTVEQSNLIMDLYNQYGA